MTSPDPTSTTRAAVASFLAAVHARDPDAAASCFAEGARYANVPHPPVIGPAGVRALLAPILSRSSDVRWDLVTSAYDGSRAFLERVDRFRIDGREYAIECTAVVEVDPATGLVTSFRDYVDLGVWRARLDGVLDR